MFCGLFSLGLEEEVKFLFQSCARLIRCVSKDCYKDIDDDGKLKYLRRRLTDLNWLVLRARSRNLRLQSTPVFVTAPCLRDARTILSESLAYGNSDTKKPAEKR